MEKNKEEKTAEDHGLENFSSKIRKIYIPLPDFHFFHRPSKWDDINPYFIGRKQIADKLKHWLSGTGGNSTGAYLITGYRGMGKTSFVGKVIDEIIQEQRKKIQKKKSEIWWFLRYIAFLFFFIGYNTLFSHKNDWSFIKTFWFWFLFLTILGCLIGIILNLILYKKKNGTVGRPDGKRRMFTKIIISAITITPLFEALVHLDTSTTVAKRIELLLIGIMFAVFLLLFFTSPGALLSFKEATRRKYILNIKINIGNEVRETKDILALLAYSIRKVVTEYITDRSSIFKRNTAIRGMRWSVVAVLSILIFEYTLPFVEPAAQDFFDKKDKGFLFRTLEALNTILYQFRDQHKIFARAAGMALSCIAAYGITQLVVLLVNTIGNYIGIRKHNKEKILRDLNRLCDRIDSSIYEDKDNAANNIGVPGFNMAFSRRKVKNYQPASIREIEQSLVQIIHDVNNSKVLSCRMIVIFDELDKLVCQRNSEVPKENIYPEFTVDENGVSDDISVNEKKHKILGLLGQLKFFISTAEAKFIFIAGHELYDAYLADVSDREYSVSSIFNGVINVDSFFSCNQRTNDITRMTEAFLCKHLMVDPNKKGKDDNGIEGRSEGANRAGNKIKGESKNKSKGEGKEEEKEEIEQYNLKEYAKTIKINKEDADAIWKQREKEAVLAFLRQFVTYLTFMSNGAPQKLVTNFEKYVISKEEYERQHEKNKFDITIGSPSTKAGFYLAFGYRDQQRIGFIHYMANPVFENMISPSSEFGDKLLIASSFLIAHIYKYHNSGFSRRNLEYMPELLDSNRSPELRSFIDSILGYLGQIHLSPITLGIYSYKFPMRLAEEISVFSKKSEEISAVFNFSLDDSLAVKKYYYRLFDFYHQNQKGSEAIKGAFHHNLGDIHLASNEYTEAIAQYRLTAQLIESVLQMQLQQENQCANIGMVAMQVMRYTRVMLKAGLAYEKRNSLDSAYLIYNTLTSRLISFREIDEQAIGLEQKIVKSKSNVDYGLDGKRVLMIEQTGYSADNQQYYTETEREEDYNDLVCWTYGDELVNNLSDRLSPQKYALISKLSVFEDLQLAFLPILAKLFAMEKHNVCGITKDNIKVADAEFRHLYQISNINEKYLLCVDFYRKLGDILYYKNGSLFRETSDSVLSIVSDWGYDLKSAIFDYCHRNRIQKADFEKIIKSLIVSHDDSIAQLKKRLLTGGMIRQQVVNGIVDEFPDWLKDRWPLMAECHNRRNFSVEEETNCNINVPCMACGYYNRSLRILIYQLTGKNIDDKENAPFLLLQALKEGNSSIWRSNDLTQMALTLLSMGNVLLSCSHKDDDIRDSFISALFNSAEKWEDKVKVLKRYNGHLERAILYYWVAMQYHYKASNYKEGVQCLIWILNILVVYMSEHSPKDFTKALKGIELVVMDALIKIHATRDNSGLREINKMRNVLKGYDLKTPKINIGQTSIMSDAEELLLAYYEVLLYCLTNNKNQRNYLKIIDKLYNSPSLTYMRNDSLTYNRVLGLLFKVKLNERILRWLGNLASEKAPQEEDFDRYNKLFNNIHRKRIIASYLKKNTMAQEKAARTENLLRFLISDSIFCLGTIIDFIQPTARTSLFTNSFCFSVYDRLYNWVQWKEWFEQYHDGAFHKLLEQDIKELLEDHHPYILKKTYLRKMSDKYYDAARSMHREGGEYQNFINGMFLLDDDLQNNTCQFYFALERYKIRSVKNGRVGDSRTGKEYFDPDSYFRWPNEVEA